MIISASQAAKLVGRNERIVRGWIQVGKLPAIKSKDRKKWEIDTEDLLKVDHVDQTHKDLINAWIQEQQSQPSLVHFPFKRASSLSGNLSESILSTLHQTEVTLESFMENERESRQQAKEGYDQVVYALSTLHNQVVQLAQSYGFLQQQIQDISETQHTMLAILKGSDSLPSVRQHLARLVKRTETERQ